MRAPRDSFGIRQTVSLGGAPAEIMSLGALARQFPEVQRLPISLLIVLENLLRHEDGKLVTTDHIAAVAGRARRWGEPAEVLFYPSRVVMQDYAGLVALIDLATMRDAVRKAGGNPAAVRPVIPVDLVIDHSLIVNHAGAPDSAARNLADEHAQNGERFAFAKWAQAALAPLRVVPPGNGIIHQVNLEQLAQVVRRDPVTGLTHAESQIGTDSHTTMINALGILAWGVGGIEAAAAMLGEPGSLLVPDVVGVRLEGALRDGVLSTDAVLAITARLRARGVVDRFVEFFGQGAARLCLADRATIANMAPEYGATCGLFPVDAEVAVYLRSTGRAADDVARVVDYAKLTGLWGDPNMDRDYADVIEIDLGAIGRAVAGPRRPHDHVALGDAPATLPADRAPGSSVEEHLRDGDVVIAAITSCTNTSNPRSMIAAGLLARRAALRGLAPRRGVKTSLSPGSRAVARYLAEAGLLAPLEALGFHLVGFGCATCVGNSGPLHPDVEAAIRERGLSVAAVLSGNRNFEGRIHPLVKLSYLASPPLVVAYALAGTMRKNLETEAIGHDGAGAPVFLRDLWPTDAEIDAAVAGFVGPAAFVDTGAAMFRGGASWDAIDVATADCFPWAPNSSYVAPSPFVEPSRDRGAIVEAVPLVVLGDNVTTDHISPVGTIPAEGPAADYLRACGVAALDFNAFGARRGNAEVMARGTFASPRLRNELVSPKEGGWTRYAPTGATMAIHEAAARYRADGTPVVVVAGKSYGAGSARDWAAKGTLMLGVRAVIAESFERIHRANLVLMGVLPLQFIDGEGRADLGIDAESRITIALRAAIAPREIIEVVVSHPTKGRRTARLCARVDTVLEARYFAEGGVLPAIARALTESALA